MLVCGCLESGMPAELWTSLLDHNFEFRRQYPKCSWAVDIPFPNFHTTQTVGLRASTDLTYISLLYTVVFSSIRTRTCDSTKSATSVRGCRDYLSLAGRRRNGIRQN
ncbi:hypothetical protein TNCV_236081 [Trichonephila clavipes]|nr:hypothetical protein TNCV_236081 [Trichonephila clavipes]